MNNIFKIAKHEFTKLFKSTGFIVTTVIFLVILVAGGILGSIFLPNLADGAGNIEQDDVKIGYVDNSGLLNEGGMYYQYYEFIEYETADAAKNSLLNQEIKEYFIFAADYLESGAIERYALNDFGVDGGILSAASTFIQYNLTLGQIPQEIIDRVLYPIGGLDSIVYDAQGNVISQDSEEGNIDAGKLILAIIMMSLLVFAIFTASGYLMQGLGEEKENRIMEVLLSSVSSKDLLIGKVIGLGILGLVQIAIFLVAIFLVYTFLLAEPLSNIADFSDFSISIGFMLICLVIFILGYFLFAFLLGALSVVGPSAKEGQQFSMYVIMPAIIPLAFSSFITQDPTGVFSQILTYFPLTSPSTLIMRLALGSLEAWEMALSLAILVGSIVLAAWFANKVFRTFLLMYGKTPTLGELFKTLKQS